MSEPSNGTKHGQIVQIVTHKEGATIRARSGGNLNYVGGPRSLSLIEFETLKLPNRAEIFVALSALDSTSTAANPAYELVHSQ
jgi:hypothetical protein